MRIDGRCHCGAITFEGEIDPDKVAICHCTDCQASTGSPAIKWQASSVDTTAPP